MHQALYRKWRPKTFDEVSGQEHITSILKYQCAQGRLSHAYLFCGTRGTGKTSCAKILAKAVNCENPSDGNPCGICSSCISVENATALDVVEMDAASNNGVDSVRDIRDEVAYTPAALTYKVYIVDEVHMLSASAFNALLKTLEEPPAYVIFILATTELHKLPATIISRCQRFDFHRISNRDIAQRLSFIAKEEGAELTEDGAAMLARLARGGMRDAVSLFELCTGRQQKIDGALVTDVLGLCGRDTLAAIVSAVANKDADFIFSAISKMESSAIDLSVFWQDLIGFYRDMLVQKTVKNPAEYLEITPTEHQQLRECARLFDTETLLWHCNLLDSALARMQKTASARRSIAEISLMRMTDASLDDSGAGLLSRISALEGKLMSLSYNRAESAPESCEEQKHSDGEVSEKPSEAPETGTEKAASEKKERKEAKETEKGAVCAPLPYWEDAAERISAALPSVRGFINRAAGQKKGDGSIEIAASSQMAVTMLNMENTKKIITEVLSGFEGREIKPEGLRIIRSEQKSAGASALDNLDIQN